jgi:hypothetical protein
MVKTLIKLGDIVRLTGGTKPMLVIWIGDTSSNFYNIRARYVHSGQQVSRNSRDFVLVKDENSKDTNTVALDKMKGRQYRYSANDMDNIGIGLAIDSSGNYVLETDSGGVVSFSPLLLKKIVPFTFEVVYLQSQNVPVTYIGDVGSVKVGDYLVRDGKTFSLCFVKAIDTENDNATKRFVGKRLASTDIS